MGASVRLWRSPTQERAFLPDGTEVTEKVMGHSRKPILCLDFDGVLHAYTSGWQGIDVIPDGPVPGAMQFLRDAQEHFIVHVLSSRTCDPAGKAAMQEAVRNWLYDAFGLDGMTIFHRLEFPDHKPPAFVTIDDRAIQFRGEFPTVASLLAFEPWGKRKEQSP